jgi:hypothetical protein
MYKKLVIVIKILGWSGVLNTPKILWYLANYDIQNIVFYMFIKHLSEKNTMVLENIMILSQNFKNTLFPNTPLTLFLLPTSTVPLTATANGREKNY